MFRSNRIAPALAFAAATPCLCSAALVAQFWDYQNVTAKGVLRATATITADTAGINERDGERADFATSYILPDPSVLSFNDSRLVGADVSTYFVEDCRTSADAEINGRTAYSLTGDNDDMTIGVNSRRSHFAEVARGSGGPGSTVLTSAIYDIAQAESLTILFPVRVAGHPLGGTVNINSFTITRLDSSFEGEGLTRCSWEWFHDVNGNGEIDPTEISLGAQVGQVFAGGSFSAPTTSFHAARGYHILRVTYYTNSSFGEAGNSYGCAFPADAQSDINDTVTIEMSLTAP